MMNISFSIFVYDNLGINRDTKFLQRKMIDTRNNRVLKYLRTRCEKEEMLMNLGLQDHEDIVKTICDPSPWGIQKPFRKAGPKMGSTKMTRMFTSMVTSISKAPDDGHEGLEDDVIDSREVDEEGVEDENQSVRESDSWANLDSSTSIVDNLRVSLSEDLTFLAS
eukprot:GHVH01003343.1.p2 GENE.GHVH01003343.1~~GHVH01003343.1.p2  ORF type:complete len:165 (-),score=30.14 GHVH01003343.1:8-502(-)